MPDATLQLAVADGSIKLGDTIVPGVYQGLEVRGAVAMDEQAVPGRSGSSKQPLGFQDAELTLRVVLVDDDSSTAAEKLTTLVRLFNAQDPQAKPFVYRFVCATTEIWKIDQVVFKELRSDENSDNDALGQELVFVEHKPVTLKAEKRRSQIIDVSSGPVGDLEGGTYVDEFGQGTTVMGSTAYHQEQQEMLDAVEQGAFGGILGTRRKDAGEKKPTDDDSPRFADPGVSG